MSADEPDARGSFAEEDGWAIAGELGLSLSPPPVKLQDIAVSMLWHGSYDHDPAHAWLRQIMVRLVAELRGA